MFKTSLTLATTLIIAVGQSAFCQTASGGSIAASRYPIGQNVFNVYTDIKEGTVLIYSADGTIQQEISLSDISTLRRPDGDLDPIPDDGDATFVRYNGIWSNGSTVPFPGLSSDGFLIYGEGGYTTSTVSIGGAFDGQVIETLSGPLEVCFSNCSVDTLAERNSFIYGTETVFDPMSKSLKGETLIAYSDAAFEYALSKGYEVVRKNLNLVQLGSFAIPEGWEITADEVRGSTGTTLISANAGQVTVANGSFRISPSNPQSALGTTISSSDGILILGNSNSHRTIVRGTLEVQDPTAPSHAASKRYVDGATSLAMAMSALPVSPDGGPYLGLSVGKLGAEAAFALGFSHTDPANGFQMKINLGHSASSGTGVAVGIGIGF